MIFFDAYVYVYLLPWKCFPRWFVLLSWTIFNNNLNFKNCRLCVQLCHIWQQAPMYFYYWEINQPKACISRCLCDKSMLFHWQDTSLYLVTLRKKHHGRRCIKSRPKIIPFMRILYYIYFFNTSSNWNAYNESSFFKEIFKPFYIVH